MKAELRCLGRTLRSSWQALSENIDESCSYIAIMRVSRISAINCVAGNAE